jgi:hypothetical protein
MLKSPKHFDIVDVRSDGDKFNYRQRHGTIVPRKFKSSCIYVCIFETTEILHRFNYNDMLNLLNIDYEWKHCVQELDQVNFDLSDGKVVDVLNYFKKDYRYGFMLFLNKNFMDQDIEKFWKMCDIYISKIYDHSFGRYSEKEEYFRSLYNKHILNHDSKRYNETEPEMMTKKPRTESYNSYVSDDSELYNPQLDPVLEVPQQFQASAVSYPPPMPPYQVQQQSYPPPIQVPPIQMAHMPQVQVPQMHPFQAAYNQVSLDPRVQMSNPSSTEQSFLNSSFGSNSSVFNSDEETMMLKTNYTSLKSKYSELKVLKDRCYRDASDFKKKLQQSEFRIKDLEHKNNSLKKDNDYCHKKNESLTREVTALKTEFNKRNISL